MDWRRPTYLPKTPIQTCPRCGEAMKQICFSIDDYSELFGMYLGDGCISEYPRTQRLRISLDGKYPGIIDAGRALLERTFPLNKVDVVPFDGGHYLSVYSRHIACLFPQHGPGSKHAARSSPSFGSGQSWPQRLGRSFADASEPTAAIS